MNHRRYRYRMLWCGLAVAGLALAGSGCPLNPPPGPVTVRLVNSSNFAVWANVYVSSMAVAADQLFVAANAYNAWQGARPFPTLNAGETVEFSLECDQVGAIGVGEPVFSGVGLGHRSQDQIALQRPTDFDCERTVIFTYTANASTGQYNVTSSVP